MINPDANGETLRFADDMFVVGGGCCVDGNNDVNMGGCNIAHVELIKLLLLVFEEDEELLRHCC